MTTTNLPCYWHPSKFIVMQFTVRTDVWMRMQDFFQTFLKHIISMSRLNFVQISDQQRPRRTQKRGFPIMHCKRTISTVQRGVKLLILHHDCFCYRCELVTFDQRNLHSMEKNSLSNISYSLQAIFPNFIIFILHTFSRSGKLA